MIVKGKKAILYIAAVVCFTVIMLVGPAALACGSQGPGAGPGFGQPPSPPTNLKVSNMTDTSATVSWKAPSNSKNIKGYNVYRDGALAGTSATTSFADSGLTPNTAYTWTVKSYDASNRQSAASASVSAATYLIIRGTVEWSSSTAPGPILAGLYVEKDAYLGIDAGVTVKLNPGVSAYVYGTMESTGSEGNLVVFTSSTVAGKSASGKSVTSCHTKTVTKYFGSIYVEQGGTFTGDYTKIVYGSTLVTVMGQLTLTNSEIAYAQKTGLLVDATGEFDGISDKIHDCCENTSTCKGIDAKGAVNLTSSDIYSCAGTGVLVEASGNFNGTSVNITKCGKGVEIRGAINFVLSTVGSCKYGLYFNTSTFSGVILNSFVGNDTYGVYNAKPDAVTIDASMNYWGSPDGPSVYDPTTKTWSAAGDKVSSGVTYDNWLTEPAQ